ncbi:hypothetical protein [Moheibacter sediminis]|uniref:Lipocalin-like domain-containing protein n=1 Tax=Moheibacter sediminis TaxID=1434700 RepID=A0A1W1ZVJ0_9FLAO|nr:hypothetical protein [Moheibacter sediminis]SMC52427.1 hypothetical protein SAMN06296427_103269 [Moheibacter sediminis]
MKKLFIIAGFLSLTACTNDEGLFTIIDGPVTLEGSWKLTSMLVETPVDINGDGISGTDFMIESECYQNETAVFSANLTGQTQSTSYLEIAVSGSFPDDVTFTTECVLENETTDFTWLQNENTVTVITETGTMTGTLTGNVLTFVIPNGQIYMDENFEVVLMEDLTMVYTKQ